MTKYPYFPEIRCNAYAPWVLQKRLDYIERVDRDDRNPCPPRTAEMRAIRINLAQRGIAPARA